MARQNRVTPESRIIADPARGDRMGNRGVLHDEDGNIVAPVRHRNWVCCVLRFKDRRRTIMRPGCYTELFFLDEATALSAGHRPCGECRRADYERFRAAWALATGTLPSAKEMDAALHPARVVPRRRTQVTHEADMAALPDGAFIRWQDRPALVLGDTLRPWTPSGYDPAVARPARGSVTVLTPAPTIAVLRAGYRPALHATAG